MIMMERKNDGKNQEEMKSNLDKANSELGERKLQNQALQEKLEAIQESCNQLNLMHKRDIEQLKKAQEQIKSMQAAVVANTQTGAQTQQQSNASQQAVAQGQNKPQQPPLPVV